MADHKFSDDNFETENDRTCRKLLELRSAVFDSSDSENITYTEFADKTKTSQKGSTDEESLLDENNQKVDKTSNGLKRSKQTLLKYLQVMRTENKIYFRKIMQQINSLKKKVDKLQTSILDINNSSEDLQYIPEVPFDSKDSFIAFDKSLSNDANKIKILERNFARCGGEDVTHFIKKNLRKLITDKAAHFFCWSGTDSKISVKNFNTILTLRRVCLSTIKHSTETLIDYHIKRFFQYARQRIYLSNKSI